MSQGQKNFLNSFENMLQCYNEWGVTLHEDIKDLSIGTSHADFKNLEDGIKNYRAMANLIGVKPSMDEWNYSQLTSVMRQKCRSINYSNNDVQKIITKLSLTEKMRDLFTRG